MRRWDLCGQEGEHLVPRLRAGFGAQLASEGWVHRMSSWRLCDERQHQQQQQQRERVFCVSSVPLRVLRAQGRIHRVRAVRSWVSLWGAWGERVLCVPCGQISRREFPCFGL